MALWEAIDDKGFKATADYNPDHTYTVTVTKKDGEFMSESFLAGYPPRFGIDIDDLMKIEEIAEKLANELEK